MPVDGLSLIHVSAFIVYNNGEYYYLNNTIEKPWNNGKEVPRWGENESLNNWGMYQTREWGQTTNGTAAQRHGSQSHGLIIFDVQAWSEKLY